MRAIRCGPAWHVAAGLAALAAAGILCRWLSAEWAVGAALKVLLPALALGIVPGAALGCACGLKARGDALSALGYSVALSLAIAQIGTVACLSLGV